MALIPGFGLFVLWISCLLMSLDIGLVGSRADMETSAYLYDKGLV